MHTGNITCQLRKAAECKEGKVQKGTGKKKKSTGKD